MVAQSEAAGVHFAGCEPPSSQRCGVPVDALRPRVADAPCATVPLTPARSALLISVYWREKPSYTRIKCPIFHQPHYKNNLGGIMKFVYRTSGPICVSWGPREL